MLDNDKNVVGSAARIGVAVTSSPELRSTGTGVSSRSVSPVIDGVDGVLKSNPISQDGLTEYLFPGAEPTLEREFDANGNPINVDADGNPVPPGPLFENVVEIPSNPNDLPVEDFFSFHSSHQIQYVLQFGEEIDGTDGARLATFEQDGNRFDVVAVPGERGVFVLQQLTKNDLATISRETEQALAAAVATLPRELQTQIESVLGAQSGQAAIDALNELTDAAIAEIDGLFDKPGAGDFSEAQIEEFRAAFSDQIVNIQVLSEQSRFLDLTEIRTRVDEILRRAKRADEFFVVVQTPPTPLEPVESGLLINMNAPVGDDGSQDVLRTAFDTFIAQETRLNDLADQRIQLAQTGSLIGGRALDGPTLIAIFQLNYSLTREAEVNVETEELNQQNSILRVYVEIQQLINDALRKFGTGENAAKERRNILGNENKSENINDLDDRVRFLISFMETDAREASSVEHSIESFRNVVRPTLDAVDIENGELKRVSQSNLSSLATQYADASNQVNQQTQIKANEISSTNRELNRNIELTSNALRRLHDALINISRT